MTGEHPFFVRTYRARDSLLSPDDDGEWKETRYLRPGDEIKLASGRWARVSGIRFKGAGQVYNFTVEGNHNYFVGGSGLLTHNACVPLSGKNPPINKARQELHKNGTPDKSQFDPNLDADGLTKQAWEMGKPYYDKNGKIRGKLYTFDSPIGVNKGVKVNTIDVRFSRKNGIHGFPSFKTER